MNVVLVSGHKKNWDAGASTVFLHLQQELCRLGHQCVLFHEEDYALPRLPDALSKASSALRIASRLAAQVRRADVVEVAGNLGWRLFRTLRALPQAERPLLVARLHGLEFKDEQARIDEEIAGHLRLPWKYRTATRHWTNWQELRTMALADAVICHSSRDVDAIVTARLKPEGAVHLMPLGSEPSYDVSRDYTPGRGKLLFWGSWVERKGISALPRAFELAHRLRPGLTLSLGGTGISEDVLHRQFAPEARERVRILPFVTRKEHLSLLLNHDIFLFPSLSEGFGLALLEAMATGMPCITTLTGMGHDWLEHGRNCLVVPMSAPTALAQAIERLSADPDLCRTLGSEARRTARGLTWARLGENTSEVYKRLVMLKAGK